MRIRMPRNKQKVDEPVGTSTEEGRFGVWLRIIGQLSTAMSQRSWLRAPAHRSAGACLSSIIHENTRPVAWLGFFLEIPQPLIRVWPSVMIIHTRFEKGARGVLVIERMGSSGSYVSWEAAAAIVLFCCVHTGSRKYLNACQRRRVQQDKQAKRSSIDKYVHGCIGTSACGISWRSFVTRDLPLTTFYFRSITNQPVSCCDLFEKCVPEMC